MVTFNRVCGLIALVLVASIFIMANATPRAAAGDALVIPRTPCPTEDSSFCVWDGKHMGNGVGRSFLALKDGTVLFITHKWAHKIVSKAS